MPNISEFKKSNFLGRADVKSPILVTIDGCTQENVAKEGAPQELKWALSFVETEKPLVLNYTNAQVIAQITGSPETDLWNGHKIVLYDDPNVSFGGKLVGGIRVRAPKKPAASPVQKAAPAPKQEPEEDENQY